MAYIYPHLIPQNIATTGVKSIGVYDGNGKKIYTIPLGGLTPPAKEKLYSFGLVSDIHLYPLAAVEWKPEKKFEKALTFFENSGCVFCAHCGDISQTGLFREADKANIAPEQFAKYKEICDNHTMPVYGLCGNHESYVNPISNNLTELRYYIGCDLSFSIEQGNDLFLFLGQPNPGYVMSDEHFQWLSDMLKNNTHKRCFVFVHAYIEEDSGDPCDVRENSIFENWGTTKTNAFMNLLRQYDNVVLFHGHSHMKFGLQEVDSTANYTEKNGFKSVHVPSLATPRDIKYTYVKRDANGEVVETNETIIPDTSGSLGTLEKMASKDDPYASQGYIVDVYDDCIVLNGWDFVNNNPVPIGTYKIDT